MGKHFRIRSPPLAIFSYHYFDELGSWFKQNLESPVKLYLRYILLSPFLSGIVT